MATHDTAAVPRLCIVTKVPRPGHVKTRLAKDLGEVIAADWACAFLLDTLALARNCVAFKPTLILEGDPTQLPSGAQDFEVWTQGTGDLGARMERCLRRALQENVPALVIGTDSPGLPPHYLEQATEALKHHDAVIGPAEDGGFYLLGLRECPPQLLADIAWSKPSTRQATIDRLKQYGMRVSLLPSWFDVDHVDDLARLQAKLRAGTVLAPHSAQLFSAQHSTQFSR